MNKTVSINLGGFFFHIDEDAFQKLNRYFDAIKRSLSPDGRDEIMNDIESRIAELLSEKLSSDKQVVSLNEIDQVIAVMGQPEDYRLEDDADTPKQTYTTYTTNGSKKLYRDKEKGMLGGVAAGFGHYIGLDPLWLRIILILLTLAGFGAGIVAYIILWILVPEAKSTAEKLEMTGEPITISNIEKKVREGFGEITDKINNLDHQKIADEAKSGATKVATTIEDVFLVIFKVFAKVIGAIIVIFSLMGLIGIVVTSFMMIFTAAIPNSPFFDFMNAFNYTDMPMWLLGLLTFLSIGIPLFFFFLLGLKILVNNLRSIGNVAKFTLLGIWIISLIMLIYLGIRQATEVGFEGKVVEKKNIDLTVNDTLHIKMRFNDYFSKTADSDTEFRFAQDSAQNEVIYSNNIEVHILRTSEAPYVQIEKVAGGHSLSDARKRAEKIKYNFEIKNSTLFLDNYLLTGIANKYRNQKVKVYLYLPEGTIIHPGENVDDYLENNYSNYYLQSGNDQYHYRVEKEELKCLDCPIDENEEWNEDDADSTNTTTTVTINGKGVQIKENSKKEVTKSVEGVELRKDKIIINTK
ncbi:PspC domain-containing protein [Flavobacterium supellecticarium]|uniref:PspC domain-containing protein n=1 Tax=Flavobacterium supellecticarium TaxID=2565924 RepID=A0A4S3ZVS8_9FLAO|nr:PspC domain-containing protein [Flavobacterium supellecticarium]THF49935.1 PspC domain-containing protein [Flavobacterium supellecticarium]